MRIAPRINFTKDDFFKVLALVFGAGLGKLGGTIALLGVGSITGIIQYVVIALLGYFNVRIVIPDTPLWVSASLICVGVGVAGYNANLQIRKQPKSPTQHDVELFKRFQEILTESDLAFLRTHNFGSPFLRARTNGVFDLAEAWSGARYEFGEPELEELFSKVKMRAKDLAEALAVYTYVHSQNSNLSTALPDRFDDMNVPQHLRGAIRLLNEQATAFTKSVDEFERLALQRLMVPIALS
ncbi:MAG: hypothetical protein LCH93_20230 [Proteobacteria bacterium]|nr:hypothetical protein [Pseudomonadota bacterium]